MREKTPLETDGTQLGSRRPAGSDLTTARDCCPVDILTSKHQDHGHLPVEDGAQVVLLVEPVGQVEAGQGEGGRQHQQVGQHLHYWREVGRERVEWNQEQNKNKI